METPVSEQVAAFSAGIPKNAESDFLSLLARAFYNHALDSYFTAFV
jgi:hypothetical protein